VAGAIIANPIYPSVDVPFTTLEAKNPLYEGIPHVYAEPSIEGRIRAVARSYGVDENLAVAVAKAESDFRPNVQNASSTASGIFQFINGTWKDFCLTKYELATSTSQKNDPDIQIECAVRMISEGGLNHWDASRFLWQNYDR